MQYLQTAANAIDDDACTIMAGASGAATANEKPNAMLRRPYLDGEWEELLTETHRQATEYAAWRLKKGLVSAPNGS